MGLSISDAVKRTGIPATTIRYYDKKGILPAVNYDPNGHRHFSETDIQTLDLITCLKDTGMALSKIRKFIQLTQKGDRTLDERIELLQCQRNNVKFRIERDQKNLNKVDDKITEYMRSKVNILK
ncbi:MerR family transcriptional regulator [Lentilactobacillus sp. SPB1-3]|uniref:MerR family transcriptional regulator n=1 Tax=Lentilactobacillus terminaliae TaxID=3003483 RepID=A0ACD5DDZ1_9LACO|nr:MerR family transcriptional regulator [Lentilactobacillus sp. SPB1-3]MCZ0977691.1 MerR family transcriptional regulator [Lentilactobacillus sp. SPB1-3]